MPWDKSVFGRTKVMVTLIESAGLDGFQWRTTYDWEMHNRLLEYIPTIRQKHQQDPNYPLRNAIESIGETKLYYILEESKNHYLSVLYNIAKKLRPDEYCCNNCTESLRNELLVIQDRVEYIYECLEKIRR